MLTIDFDSNLTNPVPQNQSAPFKDINSFRSNSPLKTSITTKSTDEDTPLDELFEAYFPSPLPVALAPVHQRRKIQPSFQPKPLLLVSPINIEDDDNLPLSLLRSARSIQQPAPTQTKFNHSPSSHQSRSSISSASSSSTSSSSALQTTPPYYVISHQPTSVISIPTLAQISDHTPQSYKSDIDFIHQPNIHLTKNSELQQQQQQLNYIKYPFHQHLHQQSSIQNVIGHLSYELNLEQVNELDSTYRAMKDQLIKKAKEMISSNHYHPKST
ncbi:hypothetical protein CROQUDRAFT_658397 [Cronartium quercuum f. sp. fusiforme G11]|uniref:Uncharacterized protein n=1 Tax=Cronartium quercuum f. sp. fusiforme G11 TaxID=708437 RepID=A0A9P6NGH9_9BASI|nr:hypothetical protein CROQUDRAFT_658397 [Cronartium quercuum f. sp. fusiforme G11]